MMDEKSLFKLCSKSSVNLEELDHLTAGMDFTKMIDSWDGKTVLHIACDKGNLALVRYLIEKRKMPPLLSDKFKNSSLHNAAWSGNIDLLKYLIEEYSCKPDIED